MAWNPSPEVAAARDFGKRFGANRVIILWTTPDAKVGYASYGETKALCAEAKRVAENIYHGAAQEFADTMGTA